jgi:hypothetical protein
MFWASANPDSRENKQSVMKSGFSMANSSKELNWEAADYDKPPLFEFRLFAKEPSL